MRWWPFKKREETRALGTSFTSQVMAARADYFTGAGGVAELTATVQSCVTLWESGLALADVQGTALLTRRTMALAARALALRGEAVFLIRDDELVACNAWDLSTRYGVPRAYRLTISDAGGGTTETVLAAEVLHVRIGADPVSPWVGSAPLHRARLSAGMLEEIETMLGEVYREAPIGSQIVPMPEATLAELDAMGHSFRGRRGRVMLHESTQVSAAGGPAPHTDWTPKTITPDLSRAMPKEILEASQTSVLGVFGVLPALQDRIAQGPLVREAQRHLAGWILQPIAMLIAEEATEKLGAEVSIDVLRPLQAYDAGGRARALNSIVEALATAKEKGLSPAEVNAALTVVNLGEGDRAA